MQESNIGWTTKTWNPVHGCSKVSAGCENCYAERISNQYGHTTEPWTAENADQNVMVRPDKLDEPYSIDEPSRIFVNSMSDLFHTLVPTEFVQDVLDVCADNPQHIFQILTKRPGRAAHEELDWPENVWMGTSVEDERVKERLDLLRPCEAGLLFVSFEPLIGPVGEVDLTGYGWAIVGGESGPGYREMDHDWAAEIYRQCREQDVSFFFKQSSGPRPEMNDVLTVTDDLGVRIQVEVKEFPEAASP